MRVTAKYCIKLVKSNTKHKPADYSINIGGPIFNYILENCGKKIQNGKAINYLWPSNLPQFTHLRFRKENNLIYFHWFIRQGVSILPLLCGVVTSTCEPIAAKILQLSLEGRKQPSRSQAKRSNDRDNSFFFATGFIEKKKCDTQSLLWLGFFINGCWNRFANRWWAEEDEKTEF